MKNHFEHLRFPGIKTPESFKKVREEVIYFDGRENVKITYGKDADERYSYGYTMYLSDGQFFEKKPNLESGYFVSEREAKLYFLGNMQKYPNLFSDELLKNISLQINDLCKLTLF